jgi:hypothetical protein
MTTPITLFSQNLYDQDYYLWIETTIEKIKQGSFSTVDWEKVLEELEGMGRSEKRAVESFLTRILEHLLKLHYWESERDYNANHWQAEITTFRFQLSKYLSDSPSLKRYLEQIFGECYGAALRSVSRAMGVKLGSLPEEAIATLEQALDDDWFPKQ